MLVIFIHIYVVLIFVISIMMSPSHSYCCYINVFCFLDLKKTNERNCCYGSILMSLFLHLFSILSLPSICVLIFVSLYSFL